MRRLLLLVLFCGILALPGSADAHHRPNHQRTRDTTTTTSTTTTSTTSTTTSTTSTTAPIPPSNEPISQFGYPLDFGPQDIVCDGDSRVQILYGYVEGTPSRYGSSGVMAEIRGAPTILNAGEFPADGGYPDTTSYRARLCNLGFTRTDRVYLVLLDGYKKTNYASSTCTGGRYAVISVAGSTSLLADPNKATVNRNTFLHETLHTLGAVPRTAPNSYVYNGGHCDEGRDVMCYGPDNDTSVCPERTWVDCNGQDYFNPTPVPGTWLYDNPALNIGHCVEPYTSCTYTGRGKEPVEQGETPAFQPVWDVVQGLVG
jgi:hypothetical protein